MKILTINGSPRMKGNSTTLSAHFSEIAEKAGAEVKKYYLNKLNYKGCQACMACKGRTEKCIIEDDLTEVLDSMHEADVILLSSPNYYGSVTAQMKGFLDRSYSLLKPDFFTADKKSRLADGKTMVIMFIQGGDESLHAGTIEEMKPVKFYYDLDELHILRGCGINEIGDIHKDTDLLKRTEELAKELVEKYR